MILEAARFVFARQGYRDTIVDDIAERAGVGKGTLYLYFRSKEEIYLAVVVSDMRRLDELTRARIAEAGSWHEKVRAYMQVRLDYLERHRDFVRIYMAEFRSMMLRGNPVPFDLHQMARDCEGHLAQIFAAAVAKREIRMIDPEFAAATVSDLTRGLMERRLMDEAPVASKIDFMMDVLRSGLTV